MIFTIRGLKVNVVTKNKINYCSSCHRRTVNEQIVYYSDVEATANGHAIVNHRLCSNCVPDFIKAEIESDYAPPFSISLR